MKIFSQKLSLLMIGLACWASVAAQAQSVLHTPRSAQEVQQLILEAQESTKKITIAGAGRGNSVKTTSGDVMVLDQQYMNKVLNLDLENKQITVQPGIMWSEILETINPFGLSVAAMQSYCDFSVGGTIGVNAHGQDFRFAPIAQTIESMMFVDAQGAIKRLSKTENKELFSLVIGGYGLFGVITEVTLNLIDNTKLVKEVDILDNADIFSKSKDLLTNDDVALYSARLGMGSRRFMECMVTIAYKDTHKQTQKPLQSIGILESVRAKILNNLFNLARKSQIFRDVRTLFEGHIVEGLFYKKRSRNNAMYYKTSTLSHKEDGRIEVLQEYFIPVEQAEAFIGTARGILKNHNVDVLNCTLRYVKADEISFLPYAPQTVAALVFFYSIDDTKEGFDYAQSWTSKLIDAALDNGGRFYLPYYCFATNEQVRKAYPEFDAFIEHKKAYDPHEIFVNDLYLTYK